MLRKILQFFGWLMMENIYARNPYTMFHQWHKIVWYNRNDDLTFLKNSFWIDEIEWFSLSWIMVSWVSHGKPRWVKYERFISCGILFSLFEMQRRFLPFFIYSTSENVNIFHLYPEFKWLWRSKTYALAYVM